ncbi:hypothetical protein [Burkholderia cepacia]|uniref:hypothetical protein n=2 Tax=Burkholderiaceae TaxID=119060 RepID=UPI003D670707
MIVGRLGADKRPTSRKVTGRAHFLSLTSRGTTPAMLRRRFISAHIRNFYRIKALEIDIYSTRAGRFRRLPRVLLTQPAADRWTPLHLSEPFLACIRRVPVKVTKLENTGRYPIEQPGLPQMVAAIDAFCRDVTAQ